LTRREYTPDDWQKLVDDIELCLHDFRYRGEKSFPKFVRASDRDKEKRKLKRQEREIERQREIERDINVRNGNNGDTDDCDDADIFEEHKPAGEEEPPAATFVIGNVLHFNFRGKKEKGCVLEACQSVQHATLRYDGFSQDKDELSPIEILRGGKNLSALRPLQPDKLKVNDWVYNRCGTKRVLYRARVKAIGVGNIVKVRVIGLDAEEGLQWIIAEQITKVS